jgi:riboflavin kinase/FMN adenylyltransferase
MNGNLRTLPIKIESWEQCLKREYAEAERFSCAIGAFDGIHLGHRALIRKICADRQTIPSVLTFVNNPKSTTKPESFLGELYSLKQRLSAFERFGVRRCVLIDFSPEFRALSGAEFLTVLLDTGSVRKLVIGHDFRCGRHLSTDAAQIASFTEAYGVKTEIIEPLRFDGDIVSSSKIRAYVRSGDLDRASALLGSPFELDVSDLSLVEDSWRIATRVLPPDGTYKVGVLDSPFGVEIGKTKAYIEGDRVRVESERAEYLRFL